MRRNHCTAHQWNLDLCSMIWKSTALNHLLMVIDSFQCLLVHVMFCLITDISIIITFRVAECFQQKANASETHLSHRWARRSLAGSDRRGRRSLTGDTRRVRSDAPGRPAAPVADRSTGPGSLRCTCNCRTHPWACTRRDYIWKWSEKKD